jgi:hypothetical protein
MGALEEAVEGKVQSVHLEHLLEEDWSETLIPRRGQITRTCSCDPDSACEHITAAAYAFGDELERIPRVLLRWRGVTSDSVSRARVVVDPWRGREVRGVTPPRRMPKYAVLKRLGSDAALGTGELMQVLRGAYERLTASGD